MLSTSLVDDSREVTENLDYTLYVSELEELSKLKITRYNSYQWLQRIRFLVFDDEHEESNCESQSCANKEVENGSDQAGQENSIKKTNLSDPSPGQILADTAEPQSCDGSTIDNELSDTSGPAAEHAKIQEFASHKSIYNSGDGPISLRTSRDPGSAGSVASCEDLRTDPAPESDKDSSPPHECDFCKARVPFPTDHQPRRFRVIPFTAASDQDRANICRSYLAVSYCCPVDDSGNTLDNSGTYTVREVLPDGRSIERRSRAPDIIVDKAVDVARKLGLCMIWIDQECIIQDDPNEKALGIQAMDLVYQCASTTVGIFNSIKVTHRQIKALEAVLSWYNTLIATRKRSCFSLDTPYRAYVRDLIDFMNSFVYDRWHTRAWILQEMFTAGPKAMLLLGMEQGLVWNDPLQVLSEAQLHIQNSINISLDNAAVLHPAIGSFVSCLQLSSAADDELKPLLRNLGQRVRFVKSVYPLWTKPTSFASQYFMEGPNLFGPRRMCNAAVALTYLRKRYNSRPVDRLAIMANLCDYEIRFDLLKVEKRFNSLTTCMVALAIFNGDLSLFTPEVYHPIMTRVQSDTALEPREPNLCIEGVRNIPSWSLPFHRILPFVNSDGFKSGHGISLRNANNYSLRNLRLSLPGCLWSVTRFVDMSPIQEQYRDRRYSPTPLTTKFQQDVNTHDENQAGCSHDAPDPEPGWRPGLDQWPTITDILRQLPRVVELASSEAQMEDGVSLNWSAVHALHVFQYPSVQIHLGNFFWDVLSYLYNDLGETALADSIWFSIRAESYPGGHDREDGTRCSHFLDLPDDFGQILSRGRDGFQPFAKALQMDQLRNDALTFLWLAERIMKDGVLWVGDYQHHEEKLASLHRASDKNASISEVRPMESKIQRVQGMLQCLAIAIRSKRGAAQENPLFNTGMMVDMMYGVATGQHTAEKEIERSRRVSVFDVDGPCEIFTPYDNEVERLPRPECRSMKLCWVVDKVLEVDDQGLDLNGDLEISTKEKDKGLARRDTFAKREDLNSFGFYGGTFRVLDRVQGAWQCMESPTYRYEFV